MLNKVYFENEYATNNGLLTYIKFVSTKIYQKLLLEHKLRTDANKKIHSAYIIMKIKQKK